MQNSLWRREQSIKGRAGSLLSRWLGGAAGRVALKFRALFHGNGEEARRTFGAPRTLVSGRVSRNVPRRVPGRIWRKGA